MTTFAVVARFALLLIRPGMLVIGTPFLGAPYAPTTMRLGLTMILAFILAPIVPAAVDLSMGALTFTVLREMLIGLALAFGVRVLMEGADMAGQLLGYQIGLSYGSLVDPQSGVRNTVFASLYSNLVVILAFATNLHLTIVRAMAASFTALPIGLGGVNAGIVGVTARTLGIVMIIGVRLAAPVTVVLLLTEVIVGLMARMAPSLNVLVVGAPARVIIGLLVVAATLATLPAIFERYVPAALDLAVDAARAFR
jgi:flagellar biosynthetic protein FliR